MHAIGLSAQVYLIYLLGLIPFAAIRSVRRFNAPDAPDGAPPWRPLPSRMRMFISTSIILVILFALAWFTARSVGYQIFPVPTLGARELLAGVAALAICFALIFVARAIRTPEEIAKLPVNRLMPQGPRETVAYSVMSILAGISEEAAYRGVLVQVLGLVLGNPWVAVLVAATAFTIAHALQGWKSMLIIFVIACAMHALVWFTGTLVIAMVVHATYDLAVPTIRRRSLPEQPTDPERIAG
jgi:membrane protease YdiL (CAAX protease family)